MQWICMYVKVFMVPVIRVNNFEICLIYIQVSDSQIQALFYQHLVFLGFTTVIYLLAREMIVDIITRGWHSFMGGRVIYIINSAVVNIFFRILLMNVLKSVSIASLISTIASSTICSISVTWQIWIWGQITSYRLCKLVIITIPKWLN